MIFAKSGDSVLGGPDDQHLVSLRWFRISAAGGTSGGRPPPASVPSPADLAGTTASGDFEELQGVVGGFYQPSVDDVDCRIIVECKSKASGDHNATTCDHGPLRLDPQIEARANEAIADGRLVVAHCSCEQFADEAEHGVELDVNRDTVSLMKLPVNLDSMDAPLLLMDLNRQASSLFRRPLACGHLQALPPCSLA